MKRLLFLCLLPCLTHAATTIEVNAKIADVMTGTEIPASPEKLDKLKGVEVLSAPTVLTNSGQAAIIEITQDIIAPDGSTVPLGLALSIRPTITEKGIAFTGKATDRAKHGGRSDGGVNAVEFATREIYFSGNTTSGGTVLLHTAPVMSHTTKNEKSQSASRELVVYLTFTKHTTEDAPKKKPVVAVKKAPEKKPAVAPKKKKK